MSATGDGVRILTLTTFGTESYVFDSLRAGTSGFLAKLGLRNRVQAVTFAYECKLAESPDNLGSE